MPWRKPGRKRRALVIAGTLYVVVGVVAAVIVAVAGDLVVAGVILGTTLAVVPLGLWIANSFIDWYDRPMDKPWGRSS